MSIPPPAITESGEKSYKAHFLYGGGGYNAAWGLISRDITAVCTSKTSMNFRGKKIFKKNKNINICIGRDFNNTILIFKCNKIKPTSNAMF